jgi:hypothetical protein
VEQEQAAPADELLQKTAQHVSQVFTNITNVKKNLVET